MVTLGSKPISRLPLQKHKQLLSLSVESVNVRRVHSASSSFSLVTGLETFTLKEIVMIET